MVVVRARPFTPLQRKSEDISGHGYTCFWIHLLPSYVELFQAVIDHCHSIELYIDPTTVVCDFVIKILQIVLSPAIAFQGCFYHLTQATWRKIQELGLSLQYSTDEEFKLFCGQIDAPTFLPFEDIPAGMTSLRDNTPDGADKLLPYFDRTYVTGSYRRAQPGHGQIGILVKRIPPLYPPAVWNVHEVTLAGEPRTNNEYEGWNNRFTHLIGYSHLDTD